jgi:hypothetical protein
MKGSFPHKGKIKLEKKITPETMAKIVVAVGEQEEVEAQEKLLRKEWKKQNKIVEMLN